MKFGVDRIPPIENSSSSNSSDGPQKRGCIPLIIQNIAWKGIIHRDELKRLCEPRSSAVRVVLHHLREVGLVYTTLNGYVVSIPYVLYLSEVCGGDKWVEVLKTKIQSLSEDDVKKIKELVDSSVGSLKQLIKLEYTFTALIEELERKVVESFNSEVLKAPKDQCRSLYSFIEYVLSLLATLLVHSIRNQGDPYSIKELLKTYYRLHRKVVSTVKSKFKDEQNASHIAQMIEDLSKPYTETIEGLLQLVNIIASIGRYPRKRKATISNNIVEEVIKEIQESGKVELTSERKSYIRKLLIETTNSTIYYPKSCNIPYA